MVQLRKLLQFPAAVLAVIALAGMMGSATLGSEQKLALSKFYRVADGKATNEPTTASGGTTQAAITATDRVG